MEENKSGFIKTRSSEDDEVSNANGTDLVRKDSQQDQGLLCTSLENPANSSRALEPEKTGENIHAEKISNHFNEFAFSAFGPCLRPSSPVVPFHSMGFPHSRSRRFTRITRPPLGLAPLSKRYLGVRSSSVLSSLNMHELRMRKDILAANLLAFVKHIMNSSIGEGKCIGEDEFRKKNISFLNNGILKRQGVPALRHTLLTLRSILENETQIHQTKKSDETLAPAWEEASTSSSESSDSELMDINDAFEDMNIDD
ncbi:hypothetical protein Aperf_G00000037781 [Anoplocephala perfoliata]